MDINDLAFGQIKELISIFGHPDTSVSPCQWKLNRFYFIRTVTMAQTGRLIAVSDKELVLTDAAWIADTGRFGAALASCDFSEVEMFPAGEVIVGRGAVIDACMIRELPKVTK